MGNLPVIVLTAENTQKDPELPQAERDALSKAWRSMHEEEAKLSTRGENRLVPDAGHMIPSQRPEAVVGVATSLIPRREVGASSKAPPR